jgi:hypothetical protein
MIVHHSEADFISRVQGLNTENFILALLDEWKVII